ncbi:MAG: hypothetical protein GY749_16085 [Desulfobacteraceae bacterium]|nr:hypothetical protein [Desulfobacteraceae bacterium]
MPSKFRLGDIRAERYTLHSHAEHGNEDKMGKPLKDFPILTRNPVDSGLKSKNP